MTQKSFGIFESIMDLGTDETAPEEAVIDAESSQASQDEETESSPEAETVAPPVAKQEERLLDPAVASARFIECCKDSILANTPRREEPVEETSSFFTAKGFSFSFEGPVPTARPQRASRNVQAEEAERSLSAAEAARQRIMATPRRRPTPSEPQASNEDDAESTSDSEAYLPAVEETHVSVSVSVSEAEMEVVDTPLIETPPVTPAIETPEPVQEVAAEAAKPAAEPWQFIVPVAEPPARDELSYPGFVLPETLIWEADDEKPVQANVEMPEHEATSEQVDIAPEVIEEQPVAANPMPIFTVEATEPEAVEVEAEAIGEDDAPEVEDDEQSSQEEAVLEPEAAEPEVAELPDEPRDTSSTPEAAEVKTPEVEATVEEEDFSVSPLVTPDSTPEPEPAPAPVREEAKEIAPPQPEKRPAPRQIEVSAATISVVDVTTSAEKPAKKKASAWDVFHSRLGDL